MRVRLMATTILLFTAPSGQPTSVDVYEINSTSVLVHWEEVSCPQRNGEITGYVVNVSNAQGMLRVSSEQRNATLTKLDPDTTYTIRVAAKNSMGVGPFSGPVFKNRTVSTGKRHTELKKYFYVWVNEHTGARATHLLMYGCVEWMHVTDTFISQECLKFLTSMLQQLMQLPSNRRAQWDAHWRLL